MPEAQAPLSCPLCGASSFEPAVITRGDGTSSEGWLRCTACQRYSVSIRPGAPYVPPQVKRRR